MSVLKKLEMERQFSGISKYLDFYFSGNLEAMSFDKFLNGMMMITKMMDEFKSNLMDYVEGIDENGNYVISSQVMEELQLYFKVIVELEKFIKDWERL